MPPLRTYRLFISHSWKYSDEYVRFVNLLNNAKYFRWTNYSCPEHDPAIDPTTQVGKRKLTEALRNQIRPVHCVIILSGMYINYSYWIQKEIDIALEYEKPIIGVKPWGRQKIPTIIQEIADEIVGWNTDSIIDAIRGWSL